MPPRRKTLDKSREEEALAQLHQQQFLAEEAERAALDEKARALQAEHITQDAKRLCTVDVTTPFRNLQDALDRLLPFHLFGAMAAEEADLEDVQGRPEVDLLISRNEHRTHAALAGATEAKRKIDSLRARVDAMQARSRHRGLQPHQSQQQQQQQQQLMPEEALALQRLLLKEVSEALQVEVMRPKGQAEESAPPTAIPLAPLPPDLPFQQQQQQAQLAQQQIQQQLQQLQQQPHLASAMAAALQQQMQQQQQQPLQQQQQQPLQQQSLPPIGAAGLLQGLAGAAPSAASAQAGVEQPAAAVGPGAATAGAEAGGMGDGAAALGAADAATLQAGLEEMQKMMMQGGQQEGSLQQAGYEEEEEEDVGDLGEEGEEMGVGMGEDEGEEGAEDEGEEGEDMEGMDEGEEDYEGEDEGEEGAEDEAEEGGDDGDGMME